MYEEDKETLENLLDCTSLREVLEALIEICDAKAEYTRDTLNDVHLARTWERDAGKLVAMLEYIKN